MNLSSAEIISLLGLGLNFLVMVFIHIRTRTAKQEDENITRLNTGVDRVGHAIEELSRELRDHYLKQEVWEVWRREHKEELEKKEVAMTEYRHHTANTLNTLLQRVAILEHEATK
jgi:hypothetical protein